MSARPDEVVAAAPEARDAVERSPRPERGAIAVGDLQRLFARPPKRRGRATVIAAVVWLAVVVLAAVLADVLPLARYDQSIADLPARTAPRPSLDEPLGTDSLGRSVVARLVYGARPSLVVGLVSVAIALGVGTVLGMAAGYLRGKVDAVIGVVLDAVLAIPGLVLLLAVAAVGKRDITTVVLGLATIGTPLFARLARANTLVLADREYVRAARSMGAGHLRIMGREILPNLLLPISSYAFVFMAMVIVAEGSLSYLGLGIPPPQPSWGGMVSTGQAFLQTDAHLVLVPAACLLLTVVSFTVIGDHARRRFDSRETSLA